MSHPFPASKSVALQAGNAVNMATDKNIDGAAPTKNHKISQIFLLKFFGKKSIDMPPTIQKIKARMLPVNAHIDSPLI